MTTTLSTAVVGAGMAGLTCARALHDAGKAVTVFEKSRGPSGRMSTRRSSDGRAFDHGAQFFTARSPAFQRTVQSWEAAGCVAPWAGRFGALRRGLFIPQSPGRPRFVGAPRMSSVARHLAGGLELRTGERVASIAPQGREPGSVSGWQLRSEGGAELGSFDEVVVAVPAPQAVPLLAAAGELASRAASARMEPCLALMVAFPKTLDLPFDAVRSESGRLSWLSRMGSKPARSSDECWVAHASPEASERLLEADPDERTAALLEAFAEATGISAQPSLATSHRWRYARVTSPALADDGAPCLYDADRRIGACGDWLAGARVEAAWRSGAALAQRMLEVGAVLDG